MNDTHQESVCIDEELLKNIMSHLRETVVLLSILETRYFETRSGRGEYAKSHTER
jgi:hypothetical protein